jgi:hypothetical protein
MSGATSDLVSLPTDPKPAADDYPYTLKCYVGCTWDDLSSGASKCSGGATGVADGYAASALAGWVRANDGTVTRRDANDGRGGRGRMAWWAGGRPRRENAFLRGKGGGVLRREATPGAHRHPPPPGARARVVSRVASTPLTAATQRSPCRTLHDAPPSRALARRYTDKYVSSAASALMCSSASDTR